ncbi:hypothetical protein LOZ66_000302 [Ophidiomyces ophidiicola]|nr:hypothetical protein LOZ65_000521 [Ophidiomyces ophidiicola]KAI1943718.1 hypothetical protein LOZ66_000302 [Ophidiomyces ophidiicola]
MKLATLLQFAFALLSGSVSGQRDSDLYTQAGYHVVFSYRGIEPPTQLLDLIKQGKVGGIIFFRENVNQELPQVITWLQDTYRQSVAYSGRPLLMMVDQEGGRVRRLPGGPNATAKAIGQSRYPLFEAIEAGKEASRVLKAHKANTNLAPVLDVYRKEGNFIDEYQRSYSNDSHIVGLCAMGFITAQRESGIISTAKHFPGLGAGTKNTDLEPDTIDLTLDELRLVDMAPYLGAIAAGVDMIMPSWAIYPAVDPKFPAGLSKAWIKGELRNTLGFKGVTVTDALEAGSLKAFGNDASRGVLAAQAGMDLILASARNVSQGESIVNALVNGLKDGSVPKEEFDQATERIMKLRRRLRF